MSCIVFKIFWQCIWSHHGKTEHTSWCMHANGNTPLYLKPLCTVCHHLVWDVLLSLFWKVTREQWKGETETLKPKVNRGGNDLRLCTNEARQTGYHNTTTIIHTHVEVPAQCLGFTRYIKKKYSRRAQHQLWNYTAYFIKYGY